MSIKNEVLKLRLISTGAFTNPSSAIKLIAVIIAPVILLYISMRGQNNVPWYLLVIAVLIFILILAAGFLMFTRENRAAEISISPRGR